MENKISSLIMSKLTLSSLSCVSTDRCRYSFRLLEKAVPKALESASPQTGSISFRLSRLIVPNSTCDKIVLIPNPDNRIRNVLNYSSI